jgi:hypothetical protein
MARMTTRRYIVIFVLAVVTFYATSALRSSPAPAETTWDAAGKTVDATLAHAAEVLPAVTG